MTTKVIVERSELETLTYGAVLHSDRTEMVFQKWVAGWGRVGFDDYCSESELVKHFPLAVLYEDPDL